MLLDPGQEKTDIRGILETTGEKLSKNWILDDSIGLVSNFLGYDNGFIVMQEKLPFLMDIQ